MQWETMAILIMYVCRANCGVLLFVVACIIVNCGKRISTMKKHRSYTVLSSSASQALSTAPHVIYDLFRLFFAPLLCREPTGVVEQTRRRWVEIARRRGVEMTRSWSSWRNPPAMRARARARAPRAAMRARARARARNGTRRTE